MPAANRRTLLTRNAQAIRKAWGEKQCPACLQRLLTAPMLAAAKGEAGRKRWTGDHLSLIYGAL